MAGEVRPRAYCPPDAGALDVLYQDAALIVASKPAGLLSVPGKGPDKQACALQYLTAEFGTVLDVHHLDMDTSGLIVFARTAEAQGHLSAQFRDRRVPKTYDALVAGCPESASGRIDLPIGRRWEDRPKRCIDRTNGKQAITDWQLVRCSGERSHLKLIPLTGRTHQLRLHLSAVGHPIIGDPLYGEGDREKRLYLHASSLKFTHPDSQQSVEFTSSSPFSLRDA